MISWVKRADKKSDKYTFDIYFKIEDMYAGIDFRQFDPTNPIEISHPCDPKILCKNVHACWYGSHSPDGINPDHGIFAGEMRFVKPMPKNGYWIGDNNIIHDLEEARRLIYIPSYHQHILTILRKNYAWYKLLKKMRDSKIYFKFCDPHDSNDLTSITALSPSFVFVNFVNTML